MQNAMVIIKKSQIQASNWAIGDILEDVRPDSPTRNQQFAIVDYDPKTGNISLDSTPEIHRLKSEFVFSRIWS